MTEFKTEAFLSRVEVIRGHIEEKPEDLSGWEVTIQVIGGIALLTGVFRAHSPGGVGQALVHGALVPVPSDSWTHDVEEAINSVAAISCVEAMYDAARRSVNMQAAQMDIAFEVPTKAPDVPIETREPVVPTEVTPF